jgi:hypothetical protein
MLVVMDVVEEEIERGDALHEAALEVIPLGRRDDSAALVGAGSVAVGMGNACWVSRSRTSRTVLLQKSDGAGLPAPWICHLPSLYPPT